MKNSWLAYVIVIVVSALAGVAIAGAPSRVGTDPTIIVPETTVPTTVPAEVDEPESTTDEPAETVATVADTQPPVETTTTTTTEAPEPEVVPAEVSVVAINGAGVGGLASRTRDTLIELGFTTTRATDGTEFVDETIVYYYPGFEAAAAAVATALEIDPELIEPIDAAPAFPPVEGDQVAVYAGRDRA